MGKVVRFYRHGSGWSRPLAPTRRRRRLLPRALTRHFGMLALAGVIGLGAHLMRESPSATAAIAPSTTIVGTQFSLCGEGRRVNCVVDGDTIRLGAEKIRIADIDTPELFSPQCAAERDSAARAMHRLKALLNAGPIELRRIDRDTDRYGRELRTIHRNGQSLGAMLVAEGLARPWGGRRTSWCA